MMVKRAGEQNYGSFLFGQSRDGAYPHCLKSSVPPQLRGRCGDFVVVLDKQDAG